MEYHQISGMGAPGAEPSEQDVLEADVTTHHPAKVVLFNDEVHTFEEVTSQIIKAIRCSHDQAEALTWEVHTKGRAIVYSGELARCVEVSSILEEIQLSTQIEM